MTLHQGEIRRVGIKVSSRVNENFTIEAAEYKVLSTNQEVLDNGFPSIEGHKITTLFNAIDKGVFYVLFKYHIGPEILKAKVVVEVI